MKRSLGMDHLKNLVTFYLEPCHWLFKKVLHFNQTLQWLTGWSRPRWALPLLTHVHSENRYRHGLVNHPPASRWTFACSDHRLLLPTCWRPVHAGQDHVLQRPKRPVRDGRHRMRQHADAFGRQHEGNLIRVMDWSDPKLWGSIFENKHSKALN